jgi:hypothetical protein
MELALFCVKVLTGYEEYKVYEIIIRIGTNIKEKILNN